MCVMPIVGDACISINVCAEVVAQHKLNLVVRIPIKVFVWDTDTAIAEIRQRISSALTKAKYIIFSQLNVPPSNDSTTSLLAPFISDRIVVFDPMLNGWFVLSDPARQLCSQSQLYAFQPTSRLWEESNPQLVPPAVSFDALKDTISAIPSPSKAPSLPRELSNVGTFSSSPPSSSPPTSLRTTNSAATAPPPVPRLPPPTMRRLNTVPIVNPVQQPPTVTSGVSLCAIHEELFTFIDKDRDSVITLSELKDAFREALIPLSKAGKTFDYGDRRITKDTFSKFVNQYSELAAELVLYFRSKK